MSYRTGWGYPALIPLHFIGLDGPSYNCIKALPPPTPTLSASFSTAVTTCHSPTHGKHQERRAEPLQRRTSSTHTGKSAPFLSILALGSLLLSSPLPESHKGHCHVTGNCSLGLTARGGGLRDLMPMLSSW